MSKITSISRTLLFAISFASLASAQDGHIIDTKRVTFDDKSLKELAASNPEIRAMLGLVEIKSITYLSDGLKVKGYLVVPKTDHPLPCLIYNRGGNREFGQLTDPDVATDLVKIASWGYVVVASQYRGNAGGEGREEFGGADVDDVLNLIPLLESLPQADPTRIGMEGWSRGGLMTYIALTRTTRIAAAILGSAEADAFDSIRRRTEMEKIYAELVPNYAKTKEAALIARSPVRWPGKIDKRTPLLLLHGTADWRVDPSQALAMATGFYATKQPFRFVLFEGGDHGLTDFRGEVDRLTKDWLDRYLRDRKPWPSLAQHGN